MSMAQSGGQGRRGNIDFAAMQAQRALRTKISDFLKSE
jgi:hypothetical protein